VVTFAPFAGHLVRPELADRVIAPPPDGDDGRSRAVRDPLSFLHVIPPEENEPAPTGLGRDALTACRVRLERLVVRAFAPLRHPAFVVHRVEREGRMHTGVLGEVPIAEYRAGRIRRHEDVRSDKARRFATSMAVIRASSTPVFLLTVDCDDLRDGLLEETERAPPHLDVTIADGSRHTLWRASDRAATTIRGHLEGAETLTIADGHHRTDAFNRVAEADGTPDRFRFLADVFPAEEVATSGYHRCVTDLAGRRPEELLEELRRRFDVAEVADPEATIRGPCSFGMLLEGSWYQLHSHAMCEDLDVVVLHEQLLAPLLGIEDATSDERLTFVAGTHGTQAVAERCRNGTAAVGFVLPPIAVQDVVAAATAGRTLPPKSTWFEPKLPAGLAVRWLD
jgi:uncharacterized protein (DUF1015 family)